MATWLGMAPSTALYADNPIVTTDLAGGGLDRTHRAYRPSIDVSNGANVSNEPVSLSNHGALASTVMMLGPGDQIYERIHVFPQVKKYAFILSTQTVDVEVWNAYRLVSQTVTAVNFTGPAGVTILTPYVLPIVFAPFVSKVYTVEANVAGAAQANNTITWDFTGIPEPFFTLIGLRLLPFTISPDWDAGLDDVNNWLTDIMVAYDDTEQRMQLRQLPNRSLTYVAKALDPREAGLMQSLLYAWQGRAYGVMMWMDAQPVQTNVVAGGTHVDVDTTEMGLVTGDTVILIADAFTWFASPVHGITAASLELDTPLDQDFFALLTNVIPVKMGRISGTIPVPKPTNASMSASIKFDLQVVAT